MKVLARVTSIFDGILTGGVIFACIFLVFLMILVNMDVIMRYFFVRPLGGVIEVSEILLLYITFFGAAWVLKEEGHVAMDLLLNLMKPKAQAILNIINSIIAAIVVFPFFWYGIIVTWDRYQRGLYYAAFIHIPDIIIFWVIPAGSLLLFIQLLRRTHKYWKQHTEPTVTISREGKLV